MSNGDDEGLPDELYEVIITTNIQSFQPSSLVPVMDALLIVIFVFVFLSSLFFQEKDPELSTT